MKEKIQRFFMEAWTWCINNAMVASSVLLAVILGIIAVSSFRSDESSSYEENKTQSYDEKKQDETQAVMVYDTMHDITMQAGETRTFPVPFGTKVRRYNTSGEVVKLSTQGKNYILEAKSNASFDLVWVIEKGFEKKIKPKT